MSAQYNNAKNQLIIVNVLLLTCIFLGINDIQEAAIKFGFAAITLKDIFAIPFILIISLIYIVYRLTIEWLNNESEFRKKKWNKFDYIFNMVATQTICLIFYIQKLLEQISSTGYVWINNAWAGGFVLMYLIISFVPFKPLREIIPPNPKNRVEIWSIRIFCVFALLGEIYISLVSEKVALIDFFTIFFLSLAAFLGIPAAMLVPRWLDARGMLDED